MRVIILSRVKICTPNRCSQDLGALRPPRPSTELIHVVRWNSSFVPNLCLPLVGLNAWHSPQALCERVVHCFHTLRVAIRMLVVQECAQLFPWLKRLCAAAAPRHPTKCIFTSSCDSGAKFLGRLHAWSPSIQTLKLSAHDHMRRYRPHSVKWRLDSHLRRHGTCAPHNLSPLVWTARVGTMHTRVLNAETKCLAKVRAASRFIEHPVAIARSSNQCWRDVWELTLTLVAASDNNLKVSRSSNKVLERSSDFSRPPCGQRQRAWRARNRAPLLGLASEPPAAVS